MAIFRSRRVVRPSGLGPASIHVEGGKITRVTAFDDVPAGAPVEDFGDAVVMPGLVDSHVHVNEPGRTAWEGFHTATRAAAAGGVTTIVDMPLNSIPATTSVAGLEAKAEAMQGQCAIDVGLWGGAIPGNDRELGALLDAGVLGFKCFLVDSGVPEFPPLSEQGLARALEVLAGRDAPLLVHAELPGPLDRALAALPPPDPKNVRSYVRYLRSRPPEAEVEAIALLYRLCERTHARAHVVHLSAAGGLDLLARAKEARVPLTAETTPHYLKLFAEDVPDGATAFKCAPPIRENENRDRLWKGLEDGLVDVVVTDHSPCTPELKKLELGDFEAAWGGIASLQFGLPVVWTEARARGVAIEQLSRWMSEGPARLASLARKGAIEAGKDADLVVWNPEASFVVNKECILHKNKVTPYEGQTLFGVVSATYLRGERVFGATPPAHDGVAPRARGQWLARGKA
ncbi:MAG TPA: allantoinase AllB [Polyangiaceae bacterium]|nr:allantoinase AllB [Polyangiaceae bacterium]